MPKKEAAPTAAPAETVAPKKKTNTALIIVLIIVFLFVVLPMIGFLGLGLLAKKKLNDVSKGNFTYNSQDASLSVGENQKWPTTLPNDVPEFTAGKIQSSSRLENDWTMTIAEVTQSEFESYRSKLTGAGWTIEGESNLGYVNNFSANKGDLTINVTLSPSENTMLLSVTRQTQSTTEE